MKKILFLLILILGIGMNGLAQRTCVQANLTISPKDYAWGFESVSKVTFPSGKIAFDAGAKSATYDFSVVNSITFPKRYPTGLDKVIAANNKLTIYPTVVTSMVTIENGDILGRICIYAVSGALIKMFDVNATTYQIDLSFLQKGTYLIRAGNASGKIVKK